MSDREREEFEQTKILANLQTDYNIRVKELDLEVSKIEARWTSLLKLPMLIIRLPLLVLFGLALILSVIFNRTLPPEFWSYLGVVREKSPLRDSSLTGTPQ